MKGCMPRNYTKELVDHVKDELYSKAQYTYTLSRGQVEDMIVDFLKANNLVVIKKSETK